MASQKREYVIPEEDGCFNCGDVYSPISSTPGICLACMVEIAESNGSPRYPIVKEIGMLH